MLLYTHGWPWARGAEDPAGEGYDWAIISGGQPTIKVPGEEGVCKNGEAVNGSGLWLFTREAVAEAAVVEVMRAAAAERGFDLSVLNPVLQAGCTYPQDL